MKPDPELSHSREETETTGAPVEKKIPAHAWKPGTSGNPGGRPKGLEARTRDMLGDDIDGIIYIQRCIALGVPPDVDELASLGVNLTARQRTALEATFTDITRRDVNEAAKLVADRGWGKAKQNLVIKEKPNRELARKLKDMTDDELRALAKLDQADEDNGVPPTQH